jgi:hypothetical protein
MEFVTSEFDKFRRVSYMGHLANGRQVPPLKLPDSTWTYPNPAAVLDKVGLKSIAHYVCVRRQHDASYFVNKPISQTCVDGVRRRGSSIHQFWWMQLMDLEMAWVACFAGPIAIPDDREEKLSTLEMTPEGGLFFGSTLILVVFRWGKSTGPWVDTPS